MKTPTNIVRSALLGLGLTLAGCGEDPLLLAELIASNDDGEETPVDEPTAPSPPTANEDLVEEPAVPPPPTVNEDLVEEPAPAPAPPETDEARFVDLMVQYCAACHQTEPGEGSGDLYYITDLDQLIDNDIVRPGSREDSLLYVRIFNQSMPPAFMRDNRPSPEEIDFIGAFIDSL